MLHIYHALFLVINALIKTYKIIIISETKISNNNKSNNNNNYKNINKIIRKITLTLQVLCQPINNKKNINFPQFIQ